MPKPRCYMCTAISTSREHVPPKNLFPQAREIGGTDYRINLITVPSCEQHNTEKKQDDEFLMVSLAGIIGNNSIGYMHKLGKVERAIRNSANRLLDQVLIEKKEERRTESDNNQFYDVIWGTPDLERLHKCFIHIGHGLHQHHYRSPFAGKISVLLGYLFHTDHNAKTLVNFIRERAEIDLKGKPRLGSNQDIFYYRVTEPDQFKMFLMHLAFYGGLDVYLSFTPKQATPPHNLVAELIARGTNTVVVLENNSYEFNPKSAT